MSWTVAEARKKFAEFLRASEREPQHVERYGALKGVMISEVLFDEFRQFQRERSQHSVGTAFEELRRLKFSAADAAPKVFSPKDKQP